MKSHTPRYSIFHSGVVCGNNYSNFVHILCLQQVFRKDSKAAEGLRDLATTRYKENTSNTGHIERSRGMKWH